MGLATIDPHSQKEHTEIHKIPKFGVNQASFHWDTKHLMTGPKGNSEFCFPEENIEVEGKQNSLFPMGPVIKCFVIPPNSRWNNTLMSAYDFIAKCYKSQ